jgi:outer membrane lipoprotein SlyB
LPRARRGYRCSPTLSLDRLIAVSGKTVAHRAEISRTQPSGAKGFVTGSITQVITCGFCAFLAIALAGCGPDYSPNTYNGSAMQQANKVDTGIVVGYREVKISADGSVGAVTGGAAGGILGAEANSPTVPTALLALGGTMVGSVVGATVQHASGDTTGWEYIVREPKGDLVSVTQRQPTPIPIGQKVLVIEGKQARIVPDYATAAFDTPAPKAEEKHDEDKPAAAPAASAAPPSPTTNAPDAVSAAPTPLSADKDKPPGDQSAPPGPTPPAAADTAPPPATTGSGNDSPAAPPPS